MIHLTKDNLAVTINEKGAELTSIRLNDTEYLWQADAAYWGKHAPILFPIVGELKDGKYFFNNKEYKLSRHGFARDKIFTIENISSTSVSLMLENDEQTLAVYPFKFIFSVEYKITGNEIFCTYHVKNNSNDILYFSVGGHPAFKVPLSANLNYSDYNLLFNNDDVLQRYLLHKGLISDQTEKINLHNNILQLQHSLFYTDAIVLKHIKSNEIKLYSDKDVHGLTFKFESFPYFGIWAAIDAPFVCLEPWCGIADNIHHDQQLVHKEGINKLSANEDWQRTWSIELF